MEPGEALSSAESAAKNNVHVKFYSTDSSHFYVCHSLPYPSCSHFIPGGTTVRIFRRVGDGDNICHSKSRGRFRAFHQQNLKWSLVSTMTQGCAMLCSWKRLQGLPVRISARAITK